MSKILRWVPAILVMTVIFIFSSTPARELPNYGIWDLLVKKGGHMTGYGFLSISIWFGFHYDQKKTWLAWFLALLFAISDEIHQSFTPGRHPSWVDVMIFDGGGAAIGLAAISAWFWYRRNQHI